jgi:hypothetical protein
MGFVYFVQSGDDGLIKIGYTSDIRKRISSIKTCTPTPIKLLGYIEGDYLTERELHKKFKKYNSRGEWFTCTKEIIDYINEVNIRMTYIYLYENGKTQIYNKMKK